MKAANIPHIRHRLFLTLSGRSPQSGTWPEVHAYGQKYHYDLVCKERDGGQGKNIFHTESAKELEEKVGRLFALNQDIVLCHYKPIEREYRLVVLKGKVELILVKQLHTVVGDGKQSVSQLITAYLGTLDPAQKQKLVPLIDPSLLYSSQLPKAGEKIRLHWMHNAPGTPSEIIGGESYHAVKNEENHDEEDPQLAALYSVGSKDGRDHCDHLCVG